MSACNERKFNYPFSGIDLRSLDSPRYGRSVIKYPSLVQHSPHPSRVRHIKDLTGNRICVVDTSEFDNKKNCQVLFPPNNYEDAKLKKTNSHLGCTNECNALVTARPTLDTILSLNYFTGLQNMSFKNRSNYTMKRIKTLEGWEKQLKDLAFAALEPYLKEKNIIDRRPYTAEFKNRNINSPMRQLYSSSGRILPSIQKSRPLTSSSQRPSSRLSSSKSNHSDNVSNVFELDLQVFHLLGGILQTTENEVIKTWLLTATEREKALMVDIVRSALMDKEEMNVFVKDPETNNDNLIIYTPNKNFNPKLSSIPETNISDQTDILLVHPDSFSKSEMPQSRPPTSNTFRPNTKGSVSRPPTREGSTWVPSESIVVN